MARRDQVTRKGEIERLRAERDTPDLIEVRSFGALHVPSSTPGACKCCGSDSAKLDHLWPDLRLFIDRTNLRRFLRHQFHDPGEYDEIAEGAELCVEVLLRCTEYTRGVVFNTTARTILLSGSGRSGKTHTGVNWSARQWMLRGGWGKLAAFLGHEVQQAHILKDKLLLGEGDVPPVLDRRLAVHIPDHEHSRPQYIRMVDGTRIRLTHTKQDGGNLAGKGWEWAQWTEAAKTGDPGNFGQARGRIVSTNGQMLLDAVPESKHWLQDAVVDPSEEETLAVRSALAAGETPPKREYLTINCPVDRNPWNSPESSAAFIAALERVDPRMAARYARGEWKGDANKSFSDCFDPSIHTFDHESFHPAHIGLHDITARASLRHFARPHPWIVAIDVNASPHTALIGKICVPAEMQHDVRAQANPFNWIPVFFDVMQVWDVDSEQAARELAEHRGGMFAEAGVIIDASSCYDRHNAGGMLNSRKGFIPRQCYEKAGFEVRPPDEWQDSGKPKNPEPYGSTIVLRRLMREVRFLAERTRCQKLVRAARDADAGADGITPERAPHTAKDRYVLSVIDTCRYFCWPFFSVELPPGEARVG